jgi:hypothetical protein
MRLMDRNTTSLYTAQLRAHPRVLSTSRGQHTTVRPANLMLPSSGSNIDSTWSDGPFQVLAQSREILWRARILNVRGMHLPPSGDWTETKLMYPCLEDTRGRLGLQRGGATPSSPVTVDPANRFHTTLALEVDLVLVPDEILINANLFSALLG